MSNTRADVLDFLNDFCGETKPLSDDADLFDKFGIDGDDASDFIDKFTTRFGVEASNYHWCFHHGEEGFNIGGLFYAPPYLRVAHIPITLSTLIAAVERRTWPIFYPDHKLPKFRWDIRINQIFAALIFGALALSLWHHFIG